MAEAATLRPALRAALLAGGLLCAAAAALVGARDGLAGPEWLARHERSHPDPRPLDPAEASGFAAILARQWRDDAALLLAGLAAGCLAVALRPSLARPAGAATAVLALGSVALGLHATGLSLRAQAEAIAAGEWTAGDDALDALAGPHADALRELRARVPTDAAVLLAGTNQVLFNSAAWALHPRALYPVLLDVPRDLTPEARVRMARELPQGTDASGRWLLDLGALERGEPVERTLLRLDP